MANETAYGFYDLQSIFSQRITSENIPIVRTAIDRTIAEHNRQVNAVMSLFVGNVPDYKLHYASIRAVRNQPLDEKGRSRPVQVGAGYDVAFPIRDSGNAWGQTYKAKAKMTVQEANDITNALIMGDRIWMRDQMLAALFVADGYTYTDPEHGALTIEGLANGDAIAYSRVGELAQATDTHLVAQAGAIADNADPFDDIYTDLMEHPENGGEVISFVPTALVSAVKALTLFYERSDPDITLGSGTAALTGSLTGVEVPGKIIGKHAAGVWIVEWPSLPSTHILSVTTDSDPPIGLRQEAEPELQGFYKVPDDRNDHPFYERQYARHAGFGGWNRVGARVDLIGNASYSAPAGYAAPIP